MNTGSIYTTQNANTPSVLTGTTALAANPNRLAFTIVNVGTNVLYVLLGAGASTSVYHVPLKACSVAADGTGGSLSMEAGLVYYGVVTVAGTSPSYVVTEFAP